MDERKGMDGVAAWLMVAVAYVIVALLVSACAGRAKLDIDFKGEYGNEETETHIKPLPDVNRSDGQPLADSVRRDASGRYLPASCRCAYPSFTLEHASDAPCQCSGAPFLRPYPTAVGRMGDVHNGRDHKPSPYDHDWHIED